MFQPPLSPVRRPAGDESDEASIHSFDIDIDRTVVVSETNRLRTVIESLVAAADSLRAQAEEYPDDDLASAIDLADDRVINAQEALSLHLDRLDLARREQAQANDGQSGATALATAFAKALEITQQPAKKPVTVRDTLIAQRLKAAPKLTSTNLADLPTLFDTLRWAEDIRESEHDYLRSLEALWHITSHKELKKILSSRTASAEPVDEAGWHSICSRIVRHFIPHAIEISDNSIAATLHRKGVSRCRSTQPNGGGHHVRHLGS